MNLLPELNLSTLLYIIADGRKILFVARKQRELYIEDGKPRKRAKGRIDYTLRIKVNPDTQPIAVALIEAILGQRDIEPTCSVAPV